MKQDTTKQQTITTIIIATFLIMIVFIVRLVKFPTLSTELMTTMMQDGIVRISLGLLFMVLMIHLGYKHLYKPTTFTKKEFVILIPAFIIAINNFPFSAYIMGRAYINQPLFTLYIYLFETISIGFVEEVAFRSMLLIVLIQYFPNTKKGILYSIVISSFVFGIVHVLNVFSGASIGPTLLQMGYSFLLGIMFSIIYLKTRNIWIPIIIHTVYNFTGGLFSRLGTVILQFDWITILITFVISVIALIIYYQELKKVDKLTISEFSKPI